MNVFELFGTIAIDGTKANGALDRISKNAKATGKAMQDAFNKIGNASVKVGKAVAGASVAVGGAWVAAIEGTRDYRTEMAKLDAAFTTNGHSAEAAKRTYQELQAVLGETDQSVEAANHLAVMCDNEEDLAKWTDICTGVFATFGDSLPIEGLTESANETAKVGQVTGLLADALNWAGISEEDFNLKLRACRTEQERQELIMNHLSHAYKNASTQYKKNAEDIMKANKAQESWNSAMAALGAIGEPILTAIKQKVADMVLAAVPHLENFITKFREIENVWTDVMWPLVQSTFKVAFGVDVPEWSVIETTITTWWTGTAKPALEKVFKAPFDVDLPDFSAIADDINLDWTKFVVPTLSTILTGKFTIVPLIGAALSGLIQSNWDTHIKPTIDGFLNQQIEFTPPDFAALADKIVGGWDTYVSPDVKEMFTTLGAGLSEALGTGGDIFTNVVTGIKDFGDWCVTNKDTISGFFGIMGEEAAEGAEGAVGALGLLMQSFRGLADLGIDAVTGGLKWMFEHGEETAKIIETIAVGFAVGAIAAHPYAAAIMAIVTGLGLMKDRNADGDAYNHFFDKYTDEDLATLQKWVDSVNEYNAALEAMYADETDANISAATAAEERMNAAYQEANAIDGLIDAYNVWRNGQAESTGGNIYLDVPARISEDSEGNMQGELDGMTLESDVTMYANTSPIQAALNKGFSAFATIYPALSSTYGGSSAGTKSTDVKWNAEGAVFDKPTIFHTRYGMQGVGEAGAEAVAPIGVLQKYVSDAVASQNAGMVSVLQNMLSTLNQISANTAGGHQVVLDSGALVGQIAPKMDAKLGTISGRKGRRN